MPARLSLTRRLAGAFVVLSAVAAPSFAQGAPTAAPAATVDSADVKTLDGILCALYAAISGPKGAPRDFARLRGLLAPNASFVPTGRAPDGTPRLRHLTVDEYIAMAGPGLVANGFFEREIGRTVTSFGSVWHVMSAYDSRRTLEEAPFARGVNSIQLFRGAGRWYVQSIMWDSERPDLPIPATFLQPPAPPTCRGSVR